MRLRLLVRPWFLLLAPVMAGLIAWLLPGGTAALRGFSVRVDPSLEALLLIACWYGLVLAVFVIGGRVGSAVRPVRHVVAVAEQPAFERRFVMLLTVFATVGVASAVLAGGGIEATWKALDSGLGNSLAAQLDDGAGLQTLRYASAVAAPVSLYLAAARRLTWPLAIWNVALLVVNASFTSRLSLILALVVLTFIATHVNASLRLRWRFVLPIVAASLVALTWLNASRNTRYYQANGVTDPISMNYWQVVTYLGTPIQASVGTADGILHRAFRGREDSIEGFLWTLTPTFLRGPAPAPLGRGPARYDYLFDVNAGLTTNSVFADTYTAYGYLGLLAFLVLVLIAGAIYGHARQYPGVAASAAGVALYCLAEVWRVNLLNQGIFVFLVAAAMLSAFVAALSLNAPRRTLIATPRPRRPANGGPSLPSP